MWGVAGKWGVAEFAIGNAVSLALFVSISWVQTRFIRDLTRRGRRQVLLARAAVYLACLTPYLATGALVHGAAGGYVHGFCGGNLHDIHMALVRYTQDHDGRLPRASDTGALLQHLAQYLDLQWHDSLDEVGICPVLEAFEKHPPPYRWDTEFSGRLLEEALDLEEKQPPLTCPYHDSDKAPRYVSGHRWSLRAAVHKAASAAPSADD